jgi:hypothetical protein
VASFAAGGGSARLVPKSAWLPQLVAIACKTGVLNPVAQILLNWRERGRLNDERYLACTHIPSVAPRPAAPARRYWPHDREANRNEVR